MSSTQMFVRIWDTHVLITMNAVTNIFQFPWAVLTMFIAINDNLDAITSPIRCKMRILDWYRLLRVNSFALHQVDVYKHWRSADKACYFHKSHYIQHDFEFFKNHAICVRTSSRDHYDRWCARLKVS
ncbi:uncharacterized protein LOC141534840 isoform X2 [Cotesia typhae]|uniref:uncharacterized protein LOC141534840 isoform X2 n=1 Tax=Cotesia typhae TaxID=2053667 RepID=UPI003D69FD54